MLDDIFFDFAIFLGVCKCFFSHVDLINQSWFITKGQHRSHLFTFSLSNGGFLGLFFSWVITFCLETWFEVK